MIANSLTGAWGTVALGLANHLWQSTLFAVVVLLLTLTLRANQARTRYWLWLAASMKFLVPFSLLMMLGGHLASLHHASAGRGAEASAGSYLLLEEMSQPFTLAKVTPVAVAPSPGLKTAGRRSPAARAASFLGPIPPLPAILAAVWLCGSLVVLTTWTRHWWRIRDVLRLTRPLREGREVEALQRMEQLGGLRRKVELRALPVSLEPGIFGLIRPVLLWPQAMSERLEDAHLEAVIAHEVWHVRRRDNLTAALHMAVEALFWFHPLVWWLETRLVEERERACDEEVMQVLGQRGIYAESILRVCEFCVESPLACLAGITGADLKQRMAQIMSDRVVQKLTLGKKLALVAVGLAVVAVPILLGQSDAARRALGVDPTSRLEWVIRPIEHTVSTYTVDPKTGALMLNSTATYGSLKITSGGATQAMIAAEQTPSTGEIEEASARGQNLEANAPSSSAAKDVIVRVNDQVINRSDYESAEQQLADGAQRNNMAPAEFERRKNDLLSEMIDQSLLLSRGKELNINADTELIRRLDEIRVQNHFATMEDLEKAVRQSGTSYEDFEAKMKNVIVTQEVVSKEVAPSLRITADQEQAYYDQHQQKFAQPEQVRLSEILIPTPESANDAEIAQAQQQADEVVAKLKAGGSFDDLARQYSRGPNAGTGGDLGPFKGGAALPKPLDQTASLKPGEFTAPIRTRQGFVVLKVTEHQAAGTPPLSALEEQVKSAMYEDAIQPALRTYLAGLRAKAHIEIAPGFVDTGPGAIVTKPAAPAQ